MTLSDELEEGHPLKHIIKTTDELEKMTKPKLLQHLSQISRKQTSRKISILPKVNIITQIIAEYDKIYREHEDTHPVQPDNRTPETTNDAHPSKPLLVDMDKITPRDKEILELCETIRVKPIDEMLPLASELSIKIMGERKQSVVVKVAREMDEESEIIDHPLVDNRPEDTRVDTQSTNDQPLENATSVVEPVHTGENTPIPHTSSPPIEDKEDKEDKEVYDHETVKRASKLMTVRKRMDELLRPCRIARRRQPRAFTIVYSIEHLV